MADKDDDWERLLILKYGNEPLAAEELKWLSEQLAGLFVDDGISKKEMPVWQQRKLLPIMKRLNKRWGLDHG